MDRAFLSGASASAPTAPASPSIGYPTAGNPGTATPPTTQGPWWYHMITEELRGVIVAAGLTPSQSDVTQLLQALRAAGVFQTQATNDSSTKVATTAFANPGASLAANGYQKLPSGLVMQWGSYQNPSWTSAAITFPVTFPYACRSIVVSEVQTGSPHACAATSPTTSGFTVVVNGVAANYLVHWFAVGY